ncbi:PHA/PHB synthase family protein [Brevibacterium litoralis]|uniref:PHA/PHB synthase family protein n=1 Tax=Brevibacterium litoralis TaxID=3138935 RepID=UPI0032EF1D6D
MNTPQSGPAGSDGPRPEKSAGDAGTPGTDLPDPLEAMTSAFGQAVPAQVMAQVDPLGLGPATATVLGRAATHPFGLLSAATRLGLGTAQAATGAIARAAGVETEEEISPDSRDRRFSDPAWTTNPAFYALRQQYLLGCRFVADVLETGRHEGGGDLADQKAAFLAELVTEAAAPTNYAATNPEALTRAFQTGGTSLVKGAAHLVEDLAARGGMPAQVDDTPFTLGENMAATEGHVVFRNDLIELIQYSPRTEKVRAVPILCSPPWINKFYVMDLAPDRSLVQWAVDHGRTVFMISYRDPDASMQSLTMADYLEQGVLTAFEVVAEIAGAKKIDLLGLCLGGAMASMAAAHLAARKDTRLVTLTTLNTLLDYSEPGQLGMMVDDETLDRLKVRMEASGGVLPAKDMATAFDLLRPRDLVFRYVPGRRLGVLRHPRSPARPQPVAGLGGRRPLLGRRRGPPGDHLVDRAPRREELAVHPPARLLDR